MAFGSSPRYHAKWMRRMALTAIHEAEMTVMFAEKGDCKRAIASFESAVGNRWRADVHQEGVGKPRSTGGMFMPLLRKLNKARRSINKKCIR